MFFVIRSDIKTPRGSMKRNVLAARSPLSKRVGVSPRSTAIVTEGRGELRPQCEVLEGYVRKTQTNSRHESAIIDRQDGTALSSDVFLHAPLSYVPEKKSKP